MTLVELGRDAGLSHSFLSQVERSQAYPSITTLHDLADALGVQSSDLLAGAAAEPATAGQPG